MHKKLIENAQNKTIKNTQKATYKAQKTNK